MPLEKREPESKTRDRRKMTQSSSSSVLWAGRAIASVLPKIPPTFRSSRDCWAWAWMSELLLHSPAAGLPGCSFPQPASSTGTLSDHSHHLYKLPLVQNTCAQHSHHPAENNHPHPKAAGHLGSPTFKGKIGFCLRTEASWIQSCSPSQKRPLHKPAQMQKRPRLSLIKIPNSTSQHHQNSYLALCVSLTIRVIFVLSPTLIILF